LTASRLFGGFAFREDFVPDQTWSAFHPAHFVLPHFQLVQRVGEGDQAWLTINALLPPGEEPTALRAKLHEALSTQAALLSQPLPPQPPAGPDAPPQIRYPLSQEAWREMIHHALADFRGGDLEKVVLARVCEVRRPRPLDVDAALAYLEQTYPDCFTFLFEPRAHHAFFGATPELLAGVQGTALASMGLAGSAPRGKTLAEDTANAAALLASAKDRHEHDLVVQTLRRRLAPLAASLDVPDAPEIMTLSNIHHLYTPVQATLAQPTGILPLVELLHPTPALGGAPREAALAFIQAHEGIPRGWYAAPLGWIDQRMDGAFTVAIRSGVVQRNRAWLYAGAGIVPGSDPEREWEETGWKFRPVLSALGSGD
jgi:menaquinone-specific isochorismate synthase